MKKKILGVVLVIAVLTSVVVIYGASKWRDARDEQNYRVGTFKERLQRAKARGDKKMRSGGVIPLYAHASLDQALEIYDLVIGEFVSSKSFAADDDGTVLTWYKFKVHETLSQAKHRVSEIDSPPTELYPLASDEILIWKTGGSVELDGMEIEMEDLTFPAFQNSKKYLLILALDPAQQAGTVAVGPSGALMIKPDGTLEPVVKTTTYFKTRIENRYGATVSVLERNLNRQIK